MSEHTVTLVTARAVRLGLAGAILAGAVAAASAPARAAHMAAAAGATPAATTPPPTPPTTTATPAPAASAQRGFRLLENRLTLREPFNLAANKVRLVAFLSPSCPRCLANVGQLQRDVLAKNPGQELAVFMVWLKVRETDNEAAVVEAMKHVTDPRVQHFWDPQRVLNAQLLDAIMFDVNMPIYDVFLLYDRETRWEKRLPRSGYWMHEIRGAPGPWWDVNLLAAEVQKGLRGEPFTVPYE